jgi:hypothetical protein
MLRADAEHKQTASTTQPTATGTGTVTGATALTPAPAAAATAASTPAAHAHPQTAPLPAKAERDASISIPFHERGKDFALLLRSNEPQRIAPDPDVRKCLKAARYERAVSDHVHPHSDLELPTNSARRLIRNVCRLVCNM